MPCEFQVNNAFVPYCTLKSHLMVEIRLARRLQKQIDEIFVLFIQAILARRRFGRQIDTVNEFVIVI